MVGTSVVVVVGTSVVVVVGTSHVVVVGTSVVVVVVVVGGALDVTIVREPVTILPEIPPV